MGRFFDEHFWWLPFGSVPEITAEELKKQNSKTRNRPQLIDVRTKQEWQTGIIRHSKLVPLGTLKSQAGNLDFDKSKPVIAICHSASRSIGAVRLLRNAGFTDVRQLKGGIQAWQRLKYPIARP